MSSDLFNHHIFNLHMSLHHAPDETSNTGKANDYGLKGIALLTICQSLRTGRTSQKGKRGLVLNVWLKILCCSNNVQRGQSRLTHKFRLEGVTRGEIFSVTSGLGSFADFWLYEDTGQFTILDTHSRFKLIIIPY